MAGVVAVDFFNLFTDALADIALDALILHDLVADSFHLFAHLLKGLFILDEWLHGIVQCGEVRLLVVDEA